MKWKVIRCSWLRRTPHGCFGSEHAGLALDPKVATDPAVACDEPNERLGEMDIETVANDVPSCVGGGAVQQVVEKASEILLGAGIAGDPFDLAGGNVEGSDVGLSAVAIDTRTHVARLCPAPSADRARLRSSA